MYDEQPMITKHRPVKCSACGGADIRPADGAEVYPHRPDLKELRFWVCACGARVGTHKGSWLPLGYPADQATQNARREAHAAFDRLWEAKRVKDKVGKGAARGAAYKWLAAQLGIDPADCHVGHMDRATALRVVEVCRPYQRKAAEALRSTHDARA